MDNLSFVGLADIYFRAYGTSTAARAVGSVSQCSVAVDANQLRQPNFGRDGGTLNTVERINAVTVTLTLQSLSKANLAAVLRGTASEISSGTVTDEPVTSGAQGELIPLANFNPSSVTVTSSPAGTTYVEGADYVVSGAGIKTVSGGDIAASTALLVSYSYSDADVVEALTSGATELSVFFDGLNEAAGNKNALVQLHRVKLGYPESLDLIGDDFVSMTVTGEVLVDTTKSGAGISKFFNWKHDAS